MDKETLTALKASIAKWEENASVAKTMDILIDASDCPLCDLFNGEGVCDGCPVSERTGQTACDDTPYYDAYDAYRKIIGNMSLPPFRKAAKAEVEFLKSLLPDGEKS